jgi:PIN domain nuclease of toxin-antitoxin system
VFLLDTHVWIWAAEGNERRLGPATRRMLARAGAEGRLRVSAISLFEVTALHIAGHVHFSNSAEAWIRAALESGEVRCAEVTADIAIDAGHIPAPALGDPADRFLVATARQLDATLLTADRAILAYAKSGHVRVHDASR